MEWDYWDENWEMMVVGWETRSGEKDNLNLVIFHCVHLRIVLFIFRPHTPWIKYYIPWNIIYLFPPPSLFFSYIIFFLFMFAHLFALLRNVSHGLFLIYSPKNFRTFHFKLVWMFLAWKRFSGFWANFSRSSFSLIQKKVVVIQ